MQSKKRTTKIDYWDPCTPWCRMVLRSADSDNKWSSIDRYEREYCVDKTWGAAYLIIIENCVSSGLNYMIIPPVQTKICMKVLRTVLAPTTIFCMENISHNSFRLACERKHMRDVEQSQQGFGMVSLFPVLDQVKLVSTLTEAKKTPLVSAWITGFKKEDLRWVQEYLRVLSNFCVLLPRKFETLVLGMPGE